MEAQINDKSSRSLPKERVPVVTGETIALAEQARLTKIQREIQREISGS